MFFKIIFLIRCAICRPENKSITTPVSLVDGGNCACSTLCANRCVRYERGWKWWRSKKTRELHSYVLKIIIFAWQYPVHIIIERYILENYVFPDNADLLRTVPVRLPICFWLGLVLQLDLPGTSYRNWYG